MYVVMKYLSINSHSNFEMRGNGYNVSKVSNLNVYWGSKFKST